MLVCGHEIPAATAAAISAAAKRRICQRDISRTISLNHFVCSHPQAWPPGWFRLRFSRVGLFVCPLA